MLYNFFFSKSSTSELRRRYCGVGNLTSYTHTLFAFPLPPSHPLYINAPAMCSDKHHPGLTGRLHSFLPTPSQMPHQPFRASTQSPSSPISFSTFSRRSHKYASYLAFSFYAQPVLNRMCQAGVGSVSALVIYTKTHQSGAFHSALVINAPAHLVHRYRGPLYSRWGFGFFCRVRHLHRFVVSPLKNVLRVNYKPSTLFYCALNKFYRIPTGMLFNSVILLFLLFRVGVNAKRVHAHEDCRCIVKHVLQAGLVTF